MEFSFFVTCGRGFDSFVEEEIKDKLKNAFNVKHLGEGKFSFQISYCNIKDLMTIFELKLVERLFILLHYENFDNNCTHLTDIEEERKVSSKSLSYIIETYKQKFQEVINREDWEIVTPTVEGLKNQYSEMCGIRKLCNNPETCPASCSKKESRQKLLNIRVQRTKRKNRRKESLKEGHFESNELDNNTNQNDSDHESRIASAYNLSETNKTICCNYEATTINVSSSVNCDDKSVKETALHDKVKRLKTNESIHKPDLDSECCKAIVDTISNNKKAVLKQNENKKVDVLELSQNSNPPENTQTHLLFRVSSRVSGLYKKMLPNGWVTKTFIKLVEDQLKWKIGWHNPLLDFYINLTDIHLIIGLNLVVSPLSCRNYIRHLTLRSTVCALMAKFVQPALHSVLLDPMCGGGTILLEAATLFKLGHVIGCDLSETQLQVASCNLHDLTTPMTLINSSITCLPLRNCSIDAIVCDFPFGQKHCVENPNLFKALLEQIYRVLVDGGRAVLLISLQQEMQLKQLLTHQIDGLTLLSSHMLSLGETSAYVCIITKKNLNY